MPLHLLYQDLEQLHIFISLLLLLRSLQRDSDKKILFWLSPLLFFYHIHVFCYLHHVMIKRIIFFISLLLSWRHDQKKKIIWLLLLPWPRVKKYFFFSFSHYVQYAMVTQKEIWLLLCHYFDYTTIMKKMFFFISLGRSLCKCFLTWSYIYLLCSYITNLSKKFPNDILPRKNMCNLKNFLNQEFQWSPKWFTYLTFAEIPRPYYLLTEIYIWHSTASLPSNQETTSFN